MMPMQPPNPMQPPSPMQPPAQPGGGGGEKDAIKQQLVALLNQAKRVAQQNGLDFSEILGEVSGNKVSSSPSVPRAPMVGKPMMPG